MNSSAECSRATEAWGVRTLVLILTAAFVAACVPKRADLVAERIVVPPAAYPGDSLALENRVCNQGTLASPQSEVQLSLRPVHDPGAAVLLGGRPLPPLARGGCDSADLWITLPSGLADGAYEVVLAVDPLQQVVERNLENNRLVSDVFGIGYGPDLVVSQINGPPNAEPSTPFLVNSTVCNQGTAPSGLTTLTVYHSPDQEVDSVFALPDPPGSDPQADWVAGMLDVPELQAGGCAQVEGLVQATVPSESPYYLAAIVNDGASMIELVATNNGLVGEQMGIGYGPDLVLNALTGPASMQSGESFEVHGLVCNQGTAESGPTTASIYFSQDQEISSWFPGPPSDDPFLGSLDVPLLPPGGCHEASSWLFANVSMEGGWYLAGLVDEFDDQTELLEANNTFVGALTGVGYGPDLIVASVTAPHSVAISDSFDVNARVCNQGTGGSGPAMLRLFLSQDEEIDSGAPPVGAGLDSEAGNWTVEALAPGECRNETVSAWASVPVDGAYFLAARADVYDEQSELIESNNDLLGPLMGVGSGPDLVVAAIVAPTSAEPGNPFAASVTVCNHGTYPNQPADVSLYHSADTEIQGVFPPPPGPDWYAGSMPVPQIDPGLCLTLDGEIVASPGQDGAYYLGAIVDEHETVAELIESNNAFTGALMGVGWGPDLVVAQLDVPPSVLPGSEISLDFEVCNQGTTGSPASEVAMLLSLDGEIETVSQSALGSPDLYLGNVPIPPLAPSQCHGGTAMVYLPYDEAGVRHIGAVVDEWEQVAELIESNNVLASDAVGFGDGPDLVVSRIAGPPSALPGGAFSLEADVCNQGTGSSDLTIVGLYLTEDAVLESSSSPPGVVDPVIGWADLGPLTPGGCQTLVVPVVANVLAEGAYFLAATVDEPEFVTELLESNNARVAGLMGIGSPPDLVITSLVAPASVEAGTPFQVQAEVCNQGAADGTDSYLNFYHSEDSLISGVFAGTTPPDWPVGGLAVPWLAAGDCTTVSDWLSSSVPVDGAWVLGAIVDEFDSVFELLEDNNTATGPTMGVGFAPDLLISQLQGPSSAPMGSLFDVDFEVCNQGTDMSAAAELFLYHSSDSSIDGVIAGGSTAIPDAYLHGLTVPPLPPGGCYADTSEVWANVPESGPGYLAATIDEPESVFELIETNNEKLGSSLDITL